MKLTRVNEMRLISRCDSKLEDKELFGAIQGWLEQTEHMLKTGRAPRAFGDWATTIFLELIAGLIFAGISLAHARAKMETPALKVNADRYLVKGSLRVDKVSDVFLNATTSKKYDPIETRSSSGGSSGRSSYSGSYSGSSGTSHSGSGRSF
ncbi:MAG: hypothetical protein J6P60_00145 [Lachnospiraceae bacterium]|nr:hypothetical protein [Lachnospiraceae bacterium]